MVIASYAQMCSKCIVSIHCVHMCVYAGQNVLRRTDGKVMQHASLWVKKKSTLKSGSKFVSFLYTIQIRAPYKAYNSAYQTEKHSISIQNVSITVVWYLSLALSLK